MPVIENPLRIAEEAAADYQECYGTELVSAIVYGSAAGGDFDPKHSDINLLLVVVEVNLATLERSSKLQEKWLKKRVSRPLFMDKHYIERSLDSFPIEFLNMQGCYKVVIGENILAELKIRKEDLRLQAERELKGKQLHLLQEWLSARTSSRLLKELVGVSLHDFAPVFRALLHLKEQDIPRDRLALFGAVDKAYGLSDKPFQRMTEAYSSGNSGRIQGVFKDYASAVQKLTNMVDTAQERTKI